MKSLILSLFLVLFTFGGTGAVIAGPPNTHSIGDKVLFTNYCVIDDLEFIRKFTDVLVRDGMPAYQALITGGNLPCYDSRFHKFINTPVSLQLTKRLWGFELPSGEQLVMWKIEDRVGAVGYAWTQTRSSKDVLLDQGI